MLPKPKAFEVTREDPRWRYRGCSTNVDPGHTDARCSGQLRWMIARSRDQVRGVRFACDACKRKRYGHLEEGTR